MNHRFLKHRLLLPLALVVSLGLSGCGNMLKLRGEITEGQQTLVKLSGNLTTTPGCADCHTVVVVLGDLAGERVDNLRIYDGAGPFDVVALQRSRYLFAYQDLNDNLEYDAGEPYTWYAFAPDKLRTEISGISLTLTADAHDQAPPAQMGNLFKRQIEMLGQFNISLGNRASLSDSRFDLDNATLGMWQPLTFMRKGYAGIYFIDDYSPDKIPVLFVHGINDSPRRFEPLIQALDRKRYQPWVLYYPSGLDLRTLGGSLYSMLNILELRYPFKNMHLVAHSMGGLVSREYLARCSQRNDCGYLLSYTSMSSPYGGNASALTGVDRSPVVMPVWKTLAPRSDFIKGLFAQPLPKGLPHYLLFGYHNGDALAGTSGDGVIPLVSQLRPEAQAQAREVRGFDDDHTGIVSDQAVIHYIVEHIDANTSAR